MNAVSCPECDAAWSGGKTCKDDFYQMLYWEAENPALLVVHHLMVLSYHMQHPSLYSPETLENGKRMLVDFIERGATPQQMRGQMRGALDERAQKRGSGQAWKITGTPDHHVSYAQSITWTMTAADVCAGGAEAYIDNIHKWAKSILEALRASGNFAT
jgi:hypothetical protein